jgi:hypothetical protein
MLSTPFAFQVFEPYDDLLERRQALADTHTIADMRQYAVAWLQLADDFQSAGLLSNAALCRSQGERYSTFAGGEYIRLREGSFAELIETQPARAES